MLIYILEDIFKKNSQAWNSGKLLKQGTKCIYANLWKILKMFGYKRVKGINACLISHVISKMIKYILNGNDFLHKLALCYANLLKTM